MSKTPLPTRTLLPKGADLICPATVRQSIATASNPFSGPAVVSPEMSTFRDSLHGLYPLPSGSSHQHQQRASIPLPTLGRKEGPISPDMRPLAPRCELKPKASKDGTPPPALPQLPNTASGSGARLNKFVRRLHDMLQAEKDSGIVEWRRGLLVLHSTDAFAKTILPKYFNTRNFKTFRRQLNYYGFVHVRSFSTTGSTTTALWVNRDLAKHGNAEIGSVLMLKRVEPCEAAKTAEGRRVRKEQAIFTVEEDIGVSAKSLQMEQIRSLALRAGAEDILIDPSLRLPPTLMSTKANSKNPPVPREVLCHYSPAPAPTLLPKFAQSARQVSPVENESHKEPSSPVASESQASSVSTSDDGADQAPAAVTAGAALKAPPVDAEENVSAANLLLMLASGGAAPQQNEAPSAITPGQFLM